MSHILPYQSTMWIVFISHFYLLTATEYNDSHKITWKSLALTKIMGFQHVNPPPERSTYSPILLNPIDQERTYYHHPILLLFPKLKRKTSKEIMVDFLGLNIPTIFDCDNFRPNTPWDSNPYYTHVPSRWIACNEHWYYYASSIDNYYPSLPCFDEEYTEMVAVLQTVFRAKKSYFVAELGSRWGTWGTRATKALNIMNPLPHSALYYEPHKISFTGIKMMYEANPDLGNYTAINDVFSLASFEAWMKDKDHLDLLDIDIQGSEYDLFTDEKFLLILQKKVYRIIIGLHDHIRPDASKINIANILRKRNFKILVHHPVSEKMITCHEKYVSLNHDSSRHERNWTLVRGNEECIRIIPPYGPATLWDGEIIADNTLFVGEGGDLREVARLNV